MSNAKAARHLTFRITIPGVASYTGTFPGQRQAAADAERRFPHAPPANTIRVGTACCHRHDCADTHCPGRPNRPPRTVPLQTTNSDGSDAQATYADLSRHLQFGWQDELRYWVLVVLLTVAFVALLSLLAGYVVSL